MFSPQNLSALRVAVLAGGDSDERDVSLKSGMAVAAALSVAGHEVLHLDPAIVELSGIDWSQFDVAFIALHGRFGEDGQVQQILEQAQVDYTGSDAIASRLAFSKSAAKERFRLFGVPTPRYSLIHYNDDLEWIAQKAAEIGYPLVVKPDTQGSSLGITIVHTPDRLAEGLKLCFQFDVFGVLETMVEGTEWTVGLIGRETLPAIKIETDREFFDWQAKYEDDATRYLFETNLPEKLMQQIELVAKNACSALGTSGLARVDLRLDHSNQPWVLEVNTIPGFTDHSLLPKAAARQGIDFVTLCDRIVRSCQHRSVAHPPSETRFAPHVFPQTADSAKSSRKRHRG